MSTKEQRDMRGVVLDHQTTFTFGELRRAIRADEHFVLELIEYGVIEPIDGRQERLFHGEALLRAHRARRLMRDLGVNLPGAALALDLLDELDRLRRRR